MYRLSFKHLALLPTLLLAFSTWSTAQEYDFKFNSSDFHQSNPCKPFIGVGTSSVAEGLKVDYTVDNTPATMYGVQAGDVILNLDGVPVRTQSELLRERDKHQQGDAFMLTLLHEGVAKTIQAKFKTCSIEEMEVAEQRLEKRIAEKQMRLAELQPLMECKMKGLDMSERPILGVFENTDVNREGLVIGSVIPGKGAASIGLKEGDMVVNVDGKTVTGSGSLRTVLLNHKPGDQVSVIYVRDGQSTNTTMVLSADRGYFTQSIERDPCKVFIGVYTSGHALEGRGTRVDGVIDNTPAKISGIQPGDIILALNGVAVNTHQELTFERDKNKPGDAFTLSVWRDGVTKEVKARFKACETPGKAPVEETVEVLEENAPVLERQTPQSNFALEVFEAYPNPTYGTVNIKFEAEAVPTVVRMLDVAGREVYRKDLPGFNGSFNDQVNLSSQKAGNFMLSVQQGEKIQTKQIVLLPRA